MSRAPAVTPGQFATFGDLLRYLRRRAGLTQRELSIAVGYSDAQISRLEGNQRVPDPAILAARFVPALAIEQEPEFLARLLELASAVRQEEAPAHQAAVVSRHNLPSQLTSFIGREKEIGEVVRLLTSVPGLAATPPPFRGEGKGWGVRLLTLTGPGGSGKTRLALQVAGELAGQYKDGTWLVELASLAEPGLVPQAVASALGVREQPGRRLQDTLADHLRTRHVLLVLDNCEHLVEACAALAESLLRVCPGLRLLATSREALGIGGETAWLVPSLSLPESRQTSAGGAEGVSAVQESEAGRLFLDRAMAAQRAFRLTAENALAVAQVCERLDGIPLAIELAAARVRTMPVEQIAARLDDRFRLLSGGSRTALPRHRTLRALIDWSHNLLSEGERVLLQRLAVFRGGWTLEAAEAVCADSASPQPRVISGRGAGGESLDVLDLLTRLVDKSLVVAEAKAEDARYAMLETIRQYASDRLAEAGETEALRQRHRDWFVALVERSEPELRGGRDQVNWLNRLEVEHDNLRAVLRWSLEIEQVEPGMRLAAALSTFWTERGHLQEGRGWLEAGLARRAQLPSHLQARVLRAAGRLAARQGDFDVAEGYATESVALHRESGDKTELARALRTLGAVIQESGDLEGSEPYFREALALYRDIGNKWGIAEQLGDLGWGAVFRGDYARGTSLLEETQSLARELDDSSGIAWALMALGISQLLQGESDDAARLLGEGLALYDRLSNKWMIVSCLQGLAGVASARRQPERSAKLLGASERLDETIGGAREGFWIRRIQEPVLTSVRAQIAKEAFALAWAEGRAMTLEQAVAYALQKAADNGTAA